MTLIALKKHYIDNHKQKIFATQIISSNCEYYILYSYVYDYELENFKTEFLYYLPYYVSNDDLLKTIDVSLDIDQQMEKRSKKIRRDSTIIPKRPISNDGIYGELFLDFYLRIVKERNLIITYASKKDFKTNREATGIDSVAYYIDDEKLNICFCEAKFVVDASTAKSNLKSDIEGDQKHIGHLSKEFINDYVQFIIEQGINLSSDEKTKFSTFISKLNKELYEDKNFLDILINENICINFIFFAIFKSSQKKPEDLESHYSEIKNSAISRINSLNIKNYKIEIVFIPTDNTSMTIKKEIEKNYE